MTFTKRTYLAALLYSVRQELCLRRELVQDKPYSLRWKLTKADLQEQTVKTCKILARRLQEKNHA